MKRRFGLEQVSKTSISIINKYYKHDCSVISLMEIASQVPKRLRILGNLDLIETQPGNLSSLQKRVFAISGHKLPESIYDYCTGLTGLFSTLFSQECRYWTYMSQTKFEMKCPLC